MAMWESWKGMLHQEQFAREAQTRPGAYAKGTNEMNFLARSSLLQEYQSCYENARFGSSLFFNQPTCLVQLLFMEAS